MSGTTASAADGAFGFKAERCFGADRSTGRRSGVDDLAARGALVGLAEATDAADAAFAGLRRARGFLVAGWMSSESAGVITKPRYLVGIGMLRYSAPGAADEPPSRRARLG